MTSVRRRSLGASAQARKDAESVPVVTFSHAAEGLSLSVSRWLHG